MFFAKTVTVDGRTAEFHLFNHTLLFCSFVLFAMLQSAMYCICMCVTVRCVYVSACLCVCFCVLVFIFSVETVRD